ISNRCARGCRYCVNSRLGLSWVT
ncbi:4Fe-4S binding domain protein, partial [Vibrio cholerae CP1035(8)]